MAKIRIWKGRGTKMSKNYSLRIAASVCCLLSGIALAQSDFTIVVLPDTQYYAKSYPTIFNAQMNWIAQNQATQNIQLVLGLGDVVDTPNSTQLPVADTAYQILDGASIPYFAAIGNHDYFQGGITSTGLKRDASAWNQYFGPPRYAFKSYYKGNFQGSNENFWGTISLGGQQYLILVLEFHPRNAVLPWAQQILQQNASLPAIIVTHSFLYSNARISTCDHYSKEYYALASSNDGEQLWQELLSQYANIQLVLSGHVIDYKGVGRTSDLGIHGNLVNQVLSDYQNYTRGGNGYLRIMNFHPSLNRVDVTTYSPYDGTSLTDSANQFSFPITAQPSTQTTGIVQGKVYGLDACAYLAGVTVTNGKLTATSDKYGNFTLTGVGTGVNTITASKLGYDSQSITVNVNPGYPYTVRFSLELAPAIP